MPILVVEDEPTLRARLRMQLEEGGYSVDVAAAGEKGLFRGREGLVDLGRGRGGQVHRHTAVYGHAEHGVDEEDQQQEDDVDQGQDLDARLGGGGA